MIRNTPRKTQIIRLIYSVEERTGVEIKIVKSNRSSSGCTLTSLSTAKRYINESKSVLYVSYHQEDIEFINSIISDELFNTCLQSDCDYEGLMNSETALLIVDQGINTDPPDQLVNLVNETIYVYDCSLGSEIDIDNIDIENNFKILFNKIPEYRYSDIERWIDSLPDKSVSIMGTIREDRYLNGLSFNEIIDALQGRVIDKSVEDTPYVERFLIGGNIMDSGDGYFGRYQHQAVVTRGGRPDIQMSSIMNGTKCLILTGEVEPTEYIISEARKHSVPMISVESSTESAIGLLSQAFGNKPACLERIDRFLELLNQN